MPEQGVAMTANVSGICEGRASRHYCFKHPQKLIEKLMLNICTSPLLLQIPCYRLAGFSAQKLNRSTNKKSFKK